MFICLKRHEISSFTATVRAATGGVLKNFENLTGKHLCQSLFFNKVAGQRQAMFRSKVTTLRALVFAGISFHEINFRGCKFCHILRGFIFVDGEIIMISRGLMFVFAKYVMFMSSVIILGRKEIFAKITEHVLTESP